MPVDVRQLTIGVLGGTGPLGGGLARRFAAAGVTVLVGSRDHAEGRAGRRGDPRRRAAAARSPAATTRTSPGRPTSSSWRCRTRGTRTLLRGSRRPARRQDRRRLRQPARLRQAGGVRAATCAEGSAAQQAAALLPDSRVTAAFHHVSAPLLLDLAVEWVELDVLVLGDDREATDPVQALAELVPGIRGVYAWPAAQRAAGRGPDRQPHLDQPPLQGARRHPRHRCLSRRRPRHPPRGRPRGGSGGRSDAPVRRRVRRRVRRPVSTTTAGPLWSGRRAGVDDLGHPLGGSGAPRRVVSLVPVADRVGRRSPRPACWSARPTTAPTPPTWTSPGSAARSTRTSTGSCALDPDLVLANAEENQLSDVDRAAGGRGRGLGHRADDAGRGVHQPPPDARRLWRRGRPALAGRGPPRPGRRRTTARPRTRTAVVPIWRRPWMVLGAGTFAGDLLLRLGVANAYGGSAERYPQSDRGGAAGHRRGPGGAAGRAVRVHRRRTARRTFGGLHVALVSGRHLTWYGPSLREARDLLERQLAAAAPAGSLTR